MSSARSSDLKRKLSYGSISRFIRSIGPSLGIGSRRGSYRGRYKRRGKGSRRSYKRGKRGRKLRYGRRRHRMGKKRSMTHGLMMGFKPMGDMTVKYMLKYLKPGSWRFIDAFCKEESELLHHNLSAFVQRMKMFRALDMISSLVTRLPYIKYRMLGADFQEKVRDVWYDCQTTIALHKMTMAHTEARLEYKLAKLAQMRIEQQDLERQVEDKILNHRRDRGNKRARAGAEPGTATAGAGMEIA